MRFEVRHPGGTPHEVDIASTLAVFGRDPASDVVLNDPKCSRRHAVVEVTAEGLVVRDAGSSNGIQLNGKRLERAPSHRATSSASGDVTLTVLADAGGTLVVGPAPSRARRPGIRRSPGPDRAAASRVSAPPRPGLRRA